ncbi:hypothetical protein M2317_003067 [Microbacterium sp. ZKA21]|uniref:choice-of-anchor G family protein n=1 Tax=Microbacterium sp. ZKA21 TaxID=3381694 RepID=UPI003D247C3F
MNDKGIALRKRRVAAVAIGGLTAAAVVLGGAFAPTAAMGDVIESDEISASHGHGIFVEGLGLDVVGSAYSQSANPDDAGPNGDDLDLTLLGGLADLNLGTVTLPLITPTEGGNGLLYLGDLGTISSRSASPTLTNSVASSGIINEDGSLNVDAAAGEGFAPAELNVSSLLSQVIGDEAVDTLLSNAAIQLGALGSTAQKNGTTTASEYAVADLQLDISSPLVGGLVDTVDETLGTALQPIQDLLGDGGDIETLVGGVLSVIGALPLTNAELNELSIDTQSLVAEVRTALLNAPLENTEGTLSVDLSNGTIDVDLAQILMDRYGVASLNDLPANTDVLDSTTVNSILDGVSDAIVGAGDNSLVSKVVDIITAGLYGVEVVVDIQADISLPIVGALVDAPVTVTGTIGGFLGDAEYDEPVVDTSGINVAGIPVGTVLQPIIDALTGLVTDIGGALQPVVTDVLADLQPTLMTVIQPLVTDLLDNALDPVLTEVAQIRINEQPVTGDLGVDSFTVRALSINVLPNIADVAIELGSSTVKAADAAPVLDASSPVEAGGTTAIDSSGWAPGSTVDVQLFDPATNAPIGDVVPVVVDASGAFPAGTTLPIPATATPGTQYTVIGDDGAGNTAQDTIEVAPAAAVPAIDAADTVPAGGNLAVSGTGWPADTTVTLQLTDADDAPIGTAVDVLTDGDGAFTTTYPVPADTTPGTGFTITGTAGDVTATDTVEVTAGDPGDVNTNAAASASASADATADGDPSAQAAAEAAALADATSAATAAANADANIAAQAAATADASTAASADSTTDVNAQASVAAQAAAQADASDDVAAAATALANANSSVAAQAAATADSSTDASSEASTNANAAASASASANADATTDAVADVAAQAAAYADATADATAAADSTAQAAASAAATATSSATATSDATSAANANAAVAAQAAALADASSDTAAEGSAAVNGNASSAAEAAAIANSSTDASVAATADADADADPAAAAEVNTNATASAAASAQADADNDAAAQAAAVAAALADASTAADAAATPDAEAAAASAATADATSAASTDATTDANASAAVAAQAAAQADNSASTAADATAAAEADTAAAAAVAATATSSNDASATAAADADADPAASATADADPAASATADADPAAAAEVNTNATASASASAQADSDQNAAAQAAAVAAALADASTAADAAATADAEAAAASAATADATADATVDATSAANAAAAVAAQASAQADNSASAAADTSAAADSNANAAAAASASSTATSSAAASANAAADASATATADAAAAATATASASATATASADASADADPAGQLGITVKVPKLERGDKQTAIGTGFAPGETVTGVMSSSTVALGTQVANAEGTVTFTWTIPAGTDLGTHTVTLTGAESGSVAGTFEVVADGLATTGSDVPSGWIALGVLLLMLGLGAALVARSRRAVAAAE